MPSGKPIKWIGIQKFFIYNLFVSELIEERSFIVRELYEIDGCGRTCGASIGGLLDGRAAIHNMRVILS